MFFGTGKYDYIINIQEIFNFLYNSVTIGSRFYYQAYAYQSYNQIQLFWL